MNKFRRCYPKVTYRVFFGKWLYLYDNVNGDSYSKTCWLYTSHKNRAIRMYAKGKVTPKLDCRYFFKDDIRVDTRKIDKTVYVWGKNPIKKNSL